MGLSAIVNEIIAEVNPLNDYQRLCLDKMIRSDEATTAELYCFFPRFWFKPIIRGALAEIVVATGALYIAGLSSGEQADIMQYLSEARKYALLGSIADMLHLGYQIARNR